MNDKAAKVKIIKKLADTTISIQPRDKTRLKCITWYVMVQCIVVFAGAATILYCVWKPEKGYFELETLARIMYLYDTNVCSTPTSLKQFKDLHLSNETFGLNIIPIKHVPVSLNVLTKLSGKTRQYIKLSIGLHTIWFASAVILRALVSVRSMKVLKIVLMIFCYLTISIVIFDISMAILYIADIQQSLTKAMIIRYSGWSMTPSQVTDPEEFGGWVPVIAAGMWLRGLLFFALNLYLIRFVRQVRQKIRGKEIKRRMSKLCNVPFPDPDYNQEQRRGSLHYRAGEYNKY